MASKSFKYAKDITILAMEKCGKIGVNERTAQDVANFFEDVYYRLKEIEDKEIEDKEKKEN